METFKLSMVAKSTLINSSLISIPTYYISIYPIPDSILKEIQKTVRSFFWHKGGNEKGIHAVCRNCLTDSKTEGELALRNLLVAKHSLKAKLVFKYLNYANSIWVNILHHKYGRLNFLSDLALSNCSWFFRGLCGAANILRPYYRINFVNPSCTSFLFDP